MKAYNIKKSIHKTIGLAMVKTTMETCIATIAIDNDVITW
jgi:hypothetical protein